MSLVIKESNLSSFLKNSHIFDSVAAPNITATLRCTKLSTLFNLSGMLFYTLGAIKSSN